MRKRTETRLVHSMISAYVDWRAACRIVHDTYRLWASAIAPRAGAAFWRYTTALHAEERAAEIYESLLRRLGRLATSGDLFGPLAA